MIHGKIAKDLSTKASRAIKQKRWMHGSLLQECRGKIDWNTGSNKG